MDAVTVVDARLASGARRVVPWAIASAIANAALIITGGLVRLTKSGLGCPTWPKCKDSYLPDQALGIHGAIEFGNRLLTFVLVALAIVTFVQAWRSTGPLRTRAIQLALWIGLGIIGQAIVGGITVLTRLSPWVVALHLVLSLVLVALCVWLWRLTSSAPLPDVPARASAVTIASVVVGFVAMWLGTIVTGAGPNSGDDAARRNGLELLLTARVHAAAVWLWVGLTVASLWLLRRTRAFGIAAAVLVAQLVQGAIGYWQYFNGLPWGAVVAHMVGVAVVSLLTSWLLFSVVRRPLQPLGGGLDRDTDALRAR